MRGSCSQAFQLAELARELRLRAGGLGGVVAHGGCEAPLQAVYRPHHAQHAVAQLSVLALDLAGQLQQVSDMSVCMLRCSVPCRKTLCASCWSSS